MNFLKALTWIVISLFCLISFGGEKIIRSINVFTGVPQIADDDPEKTGGFGDIASNILAAVQIKKLHPEVKVRLLVTSTKERYISSARTSNEIVSIMIPEVNFKIKNTPQNYKGVEVIFIDWDFTRLLLSEEKWYLRSMIAHVRKKLIPLIPPADLNLNFSYLSGSSPLIRLNAPLTIGIEESYGGSSLVSEAYAPIKNAPDGMFIHLSSGPNALGFNFAHENIDREANSLTITKWAESTGVPLQKSKILFAYSSEWQATQIYIDALSKLNLHENFVLYLKYMDRLDLTDLPPNIKPVELNAMPHEVMKALIEESAISPLVTGDISLGIALNSTREEKTLVYEAPSWKLDSASNLRSLLAKKLQVQAKTLNFIFTSESLRKLNREELKSLGHKLSESLTSPLAQSQLHMAIESHLQDWDALHNTLQIATQLVGARFRESDEKPWARTSEAVREVQKVMQKPDKRYSTIARSLLATAQDTIKCGLELAHLQRQDKL